MKQRTWKKTAAFVLAFTLVAAPLTQAGSKGGLFGGTSITAYADETATISKTVSWDADEMENSGESSFSKDGVTVEEDGDAHSDNYFWEDGKNTFKADRGKITKIEIVCNSYCDEIVGWTKEVVEKFQPDPYTWVTIYKLTWTGEADSVTIQNDVYEISSLKVTYTSSATDISTATVNLAADNSVESIKVGDDTITDLLGFDITYGTDDLHTATAVPTDAGTYYAYVTAKDTNTAYTGTAKSSGFEIVASPTISSASVTLADDLALNFYVDGIADDTAAAEYTVNFTGACVDESSALTYNAAVGKYYATTHVYAKDIDKDITATLCKGGDTVDTIEDYSITQYLSSPAFSGADEKTTALITATQNFGYASAEYFYDDNYGVTATFEDYNPDVSAYATTFGSDDAKLSLVLDSKTAARLYVKDDTTGTESTINATKADYPSYHEVAGLLPQNLADEQTINVGGTDYTFSALSWCNRVLTNDSASQKNINMAKAIMAYYQAAKNYTAPANP